MDPLAFNPSPSVSFIVQNNSSIGRSIKVFNTKLNPGGQLDLMKIPGVTEEDIRTEVLKGTLRKLLDGGTLAVIKCTVNFSTVDGVHAGFLTKIGISPNTNTPIYLSQSNWYIDPINGSDQNDGSSSSSALKTFKALTQRWGTKSPTLKQDVLVFIMGDQVDFLDPVDFQPINNGGNLFLIGSNGGAPGTLKALITDTISNFTPLNRNSGTDNQVTGTIITDFTPYAGMIMRIALTSLATRSSGTSPPNATFSGTPLVACEPIQISITKGGSLGTAEFAWFLNGVLQQTGIVTAASVTLGTTGITANFVVGTYNTNNVYTASSAAYAWIDTPSGSINPGSSPIGSTANITPTMALGKPYGPGNALQFVSASTRSYGTSPPAATFTGIPQGNYTYLQVNITTGGTLGTAKFSWSINGTVQATDIATASVVTLGTSGLVINFPSGTYNTNNVYTATSVFAFDGPDTQNGQPYMQTIANGNSFTIYQPTKVYGIRLHGDQPGRNIEIAEVRAQDIWFTAPQNPPYGVTGTQHIDVGNFQASHCRFDSWFYDGAISDKALESVVNCAFFGGLVAKNLWIYGGLIGAIVFFTGGSGGAAFGITVDGDTIIHASPSVYMNAMVFGSAHLKGGTLTIRNSGDAALTPNGRGIIYNAAAGGTTALWGNGKIVIRDGRSFRIVNTSGVTATNALLLTGTPTVTIDTFSAAAEPLVTYNGAGVWATTSFAITPLATLVAGLDAGAPADGNTYAVQNPHTGTRICMNGNNNFS